MLKIIQINFITSFIFILLSISYASELSVTVENITGNKLQLKNCKLHLTLYRQDESIFPLQHEFVPLKNIKPTQNNLVVNSSRGVNFTVPNIPRELNNWGLNDNIYDKLHIIIADQNDKHLSYQTFDLFNSTIPGSLKHISLGLFARFDKSKQTELQVSEILNLRFAKQLLEPELNSSRFNFGSDINHENENNNYMNFERFFWFNEKYKMGHSFLMSHLRDVYRVDMKVGAQAIIDEINLIKEQTYIRDYSKVKFNTGKIYNHNGDLLTVKNAMYVLDGFGDLRIIDPHAIPASYIKSSDNSHLFNEFESKGNKYYSLKDNRFVHSMLAASEAVACAGHITIINGILQKIDNSSGHYAPISLQLLYILDYLSITGGGLVKQATKVGCWTAHGFVFKPFLEFASNVTVPQYVVNYEKRQHISDEFITRITVN